MLVSESSLNLLTGADSPRLSELEALDKKIANIELRANTCAIRKSKARQSNPKVSAVS